MSRGFIIATLLISTAALGICRPGRQYSKKPPCGSVTTMENNKIKNVNVKGNINYGSTTVMDGNTPCEGIDYVRQVGNTYDGENFLPNENTSGWHASSDTEQNILERTEEYSNEGTLHNLPQHSLDTEQNNMESIEELFNTDIFHNIPQKSSNTAQNNLEILEEFLNRRTLQNPPQHSLDTVQNNIESQQEFLNKDIFHNIPQKSSNTAQNSLDILEWFLNRRNLNNLPQHSLDRILNDMDSKEKFLSKGIVHNLPQHSSEAAPKNMESQQEFFNKGALDNKPQNILDKVQKHLESVEDPVDKTLNTGNNLLLGTNGIEGEKKTHTDKLSSPNKQTSLVSDKLYMYLLTLIMVFQCKLF